MGKPDWDNFREYSARQGVEWSREALALILVGLQQAIASHPKLASHNQRLCQDILTFEIESRFIMSEQATVGSYVTQRYAELVSGDPDRMAKDTHDALQVYSWATDLVFHFAAGIDEMDLYGDPEWGPFERYREGD